MVGDRCLGSDARIIADKLSKAGWSWGWVSALDREGRPIWIVDAHRDDGKRFVVRADKKLIAFLELERITPDYNHRNQIHIETTGRCTRVRARQLS